MIKTDVVDDRYGNDGGGQGAGIGSDLHWR
jgi:hypothetical protein